MKNAFTLIELIIVMAIIVTLASVVSSCSIQSSDGYQDGYIQKFSIKNGVFVESWEGEMALQGFQQGTSRVWSFYVTDPALMEKINKLNATKLVRIQYHKDWFVWRHWTNYQAKQVDLIKDK